MIDRHMLDTIKNQQFHWDRYFLGKTIQEMVFLDKFIRVAEIDPRYVVVLENKKDR